jgi:ABC-type amino acid transport substrate-binding protein
MSNPCRRTFASLAACLLTLILATTVPARDLAEIKAEGTLRHLGIPYANFVTGQGDGLDVEIVQLFAKHLGVNYLYVATDWDTVIADLTGQQVKPMGQGIEVVGHAPVKGDLVANGMTVLSWREKALDFSRPTFPTQVWLVTKAEAKVLPIEPTGDINKDIALTRKRLKGLAVLCKAGTCLDPALFTLEAVGAKAKLFPGTLNDLAPAVIFGEAQATLLDVPDALVALKKWPGKIKIIGPMTAVQDMAVGFAVSSPNLRVAFNDFFAQIQRDGTYNRLVKKYFPLALEYFPEFFK